jgi:hypothetical membrane protein
MKKWLILSGMLAPVVYVGTVILGGALRPAYSHIAEAVSELVAAGAPNKLLLSALFILYNALCTLLGLGLFLEVKYAAGRKKSGVVGAVVLMVIGALGLLMELFFPQDPGGPAVTFAGTMHIILAGLMALGTMVAIIGVGLWFRNVLQNRTHFRYSMATFAIILLSCGATPVLGLTNPVFGVLERITIGSFLLWLFVTARTRYRA